MNKLNKITKRVFSMEGRCGAMMGMLACAVFFLCGSNAAAGLYLTSAHGDAINGVKRSSMTGYNAGNCAHCHEQHAMVGGVEPAPQSGAPSKYTLFYDNNVGQTDNVCFKCHDNTTIVSQRAIINRSYSYRAGGWSGGTLSSVSAAFGSTSAHTLADLVTYINGKWGYTADTTPCAACHNPHAVQGDPFNLPNSGKTVAGRGVVVSRPGLHSRDNNIWGLWGDAASELMNNYTLNYQAPYYYYVATPTVYEPAGDATQDGSNLTDFVTFCTDCHSGTVNSSDAIFTPTLNGGPDGQVAAIDWSAVGDKHGQANNDGGLDILAPYGASNYVLSCMDCHESHGSPNNYLIRQEVNGQVLSGAIAAGVADFGFLCRECHTDDVAAGHSATVNGWEYVHHISADAPYNQFGCSFCHGGGGGGQPIKCSNCHYHGSSVNDATLGNAIRTTF